MSKQPQTLQNLFERLADLDDEFSDLMEAEHLISSKMAALQFAIGMRINPKLYQAALKTAKEECTQ